MRKRRSSVLRNIVLFVSFTCLLGVMIFYVAITRKPLQILPPEPPEDLSTRGDNAYYTLMSAAERIPKPPAPLIGPDPEYPQLKVPYKPVRDSLGALLRVDRPDEDAELIQYGEACGPVVEKIREALKKPFYREPRQPSDFEEFGAYWEKSRNRTAAWNRLGNMLVAQSVLVQKKAAAETVSADLYLDAVRLGVLTSSDGGEENTGLSILWRALQCADFWARGIQSKETLKHVADALVELEGALPPAEAALEFNWRMMDGIRRLPNYARSGPERIVGNALLTWNMRDARRMVIEHQDEFRKAVTLEYPEYRVWRREHKDLRVREWRLSSQLSYDPIEVVEHIVRRRTMIRELFAGARLLLAVKQHYLDHQQYPESLDALVPDYLTALPMDPYTKKPFAYRRDGADYRLYSLGPNAADNSGIPRRSDDVIVHAPPEKD